METTTAKELTGKVTDINLLNIGDGVTACRYSDCHAFTVIAKTKTTVTLQRDKATLLNGRKSGAGDALTFTPGGFVGHTDGTQRYSYEKNPKGAITIARMRDNKRQRKGLYDGSSSIIFGRHEHYDFNF